jgi:hypothetical protein
MKIFIGNKPTKRHLEALLRCRQEGSEALMELFRNALEETKNSLVIADDAVRIHRLQGRAETLSDFIEAVEKSPDILARVK